MTVSWSRQLETGHEVIDSQHKQLLEHINNLVASCERHDEADAVRATIDFLAQYTLRHFRDEEGLQEQYNYPGYAAHKRLHDAFVLVVEDMVHQYEQSGSSESVATMVNKVIISWFFKHVGQEDKKFGAYLKDTTECSE